MTRRIHSNNFSTTLAAGISNSATSITLTSATGLPAIGSGEVFYLTITSGSKREIVIATDDALTPSFTVTRGAEGTTGQTFLSGSTVELRVTANSIDRKLDMTATDGDVIDFGSATSFEVPNSTTPTVDATGEMAVDTSVADFSHGLIKYYSGEELGVIAMPIAQFTSPTNNYVVTYDSTADEFQLKAGGGGGSGDVVGPASSTDNAIARFDSTTGKLIQNSSATLDDDGNLTTNNIRPAYTTIATAAGTTVLTVTSTQQQFFTGATTQTVTLPVASTLALGYQFRVVNNSSGSVTVQSSGSNSVQVMVGATSAIYTCILTSGTSAASWSVAYFAAAGGGGTPGGSTTQIQYNNAGAFGGDSGFTTNGSGTLTVTGQFTADNVRLDGNVVSATTGNLSLTPGSGGYVDSTGTSAFKAPAGTAAQRPSAVNGMLRYNSDLFRVEVAVGGSWSGGQLIIDGDFSGTGVMKRTGSGTYETSAVTVAQGGSGRTTGTTAYAPICVGTTATGAEQTASTGMSTAGFVFTSNGSGSLPSFVAAPTSLPSTTLFGTSQTAVVNNAYVSTNGSLTTVTLPATAAVASLVKVSSSGAAGIKITAGSGQTIKGLGNTTTTAGSVTPAGQYDSIQVVCVVANTTWVVDYATSTLLTFS